MYNIGEVEKITGISKDRLRYYEEKGIINPQKSELNSYREFSDEDIIQILSIEYYRSIDLGMKDIQKIREKGEVENLKSILSKKSKEVEKKIRGLQEIYKNLQTEIDYCNHIQQHLNKFSIQKMPIFRVLGEMADSTAFSEYSKLHKKKRKQIPIIKSMIRELCFCNQEVISNKMLIVEQIQDFNEISLLQERIIDNAQCLYTVVEEKFEEPDIMQQSVQEGIIWLQQHKYQSKGIVYIVPIIMTYPLGKMSSYLGVYMPVDKI